jgi:hypothetical protein
MTDLQEGVCTLLGRDIFGEASANYLLGCALSGKVASGMPFERYFSSDLLESWPQSGPSDTFGKQKLALDLHLGNKKSLLRL